MKTYLKRLWDVLLFLGIYIILPTGLYYRTGNSEWFLLLIVTWLPAVLILAYLTDDD